MTTIYRKTIHTGEHIGLLILVLMILYKDIVKIEYELLKKFGQLMK